MLLTNTNIDVRSQLKLKYFVAVHHGSCVFGSKPNTELNVFFFRIWQIAWHSAHRQKWLSSVRRWRRRRPRESLYITCYLSFSILRDYYQGPGSWFFTGAVREPLSRFSRTIYANNFVVESKWFDILASFFDPISLQFVCKNLSQLSKTAVRQLGSRSKNRWKSGSVWGRKSVRGLGSNIEPNRAFWRFSENRF